MDDASEERGLFARTAGDRPVYLATELGVAVADIADDRVGEYALACRCDPRDVAAGGGGVAVATPEDVRVDPRGTGDGAGLGGTGFGPAVAVGLDRDGAVTAVAPDGTAARLPAPEAGWTELGTVAGAVNAVDPPFVATDEGVVRIGTDGPRPVGLADVRDVTATGVPRAATLDGLYRLGNGWMAELTSPFHRLAARAVGGDGIEATLTVASGPDGVVATIDGDWEAVPVPVDAPIADVAVAGGPVAVTTTGCLLLSGSTGLRPFELGLPDVRGMAIP